MKHLRYLRYLLRHKWFVFVAGWRLLVPIWRLIVHDWQKFTPIEWGPYVQTFYGGWEYDKRPAWLRDAFDRAWLHHQHHGPHHWQHWVLHEDSGKMTALEMPEVYAREMVADWIGAGRAITGRNEVVKWYNANQSNMLLNPRTRAFVEALLCPYQTDDDPLQTESLFP